MEGGKNMKKKIVGIVVFMLVATTVASATTINVNETNQTNTSREMTSLSNTLNGYQPTPLNWGVDQKQTHTDGSGLTLYPPEINAQSFTPVKDKLTAVSLWLFKYASPPEPNLITVVIRDNLTGPDLATKTIDTSVVTIASKGTWVVFDFDDIAVTPETTYYIVCTGTAGDPGNAYCWLFSANDTYTRGEAWYKANANYPWNINHAIGDFCFKTYFRRPLGESVSTNNEATQPGDTTALSSPLRHRAMMDPTVHEVEYFPNSAINTRDPSPSLLKMGGVWTETQKLLTSDGAANIWFGWSTSLDGDTALIGTDEYSVGNGSAYVFTNTGTTWTQQAKLIASDGVLNDEFGYAVSLDGNTALIGAYFDDDNGNASGSAYVFTRTGNTWTQQAKLIASDGAVQDRFGISVALDGDTALIGAHGNNGYKGAAYVFTRTGNTWTQQTKLIASDGAAPDCFGWRVALSGDTALIGSPQDNDNGLYSGSAYVFTRTGTTWTQQAKLIVSDGAVNDCFSWSVSLSGDTALIGSPFDDDQGGDSGSAYVFTRSGTTWTQQAKLLRSDGGSGEGFSQYAVSLDGDTAIIGCWYDNTINGTWCGSAYMYTRTGTTWTERQKLTASDPGLRDHFGVSVALSGNTAIIGAMNDDDMGIDSGSAYVFTRPDLTFNITGGFGVKATIKNNGTIDANSVIWQIHVEGGILGLINKTVNGTLDISVGETKTVGTGMLFGLGALSITAKVGDDEKTSTGTQFIIFSKVK